MKAGKMELTILMPCLNEEKTIASCVKQAEVFLHTYGIAGEILVADNGSEDASIQLAKKAGARVVHCEQRGYGNALRYGISKAKGTYVIMADCDMSYYFLEAYPMYQLLKSGADMVIGDRFTGNMEKGAMPFLHKYFGVPVLSLLGRLRYRTDIKDFHCGMRGVNKERFLSLGCKCGGMEFATEMIGRAAKNGQWLEQTPVKLYKDERGRKSHLRSVRDGLRHLHIMGEIE